MVAILLGLQTKNGAAYECDIILALEGENLKQQYLTLLSHVSGIFAQQNIILKIIVNYVDSLEQEYREEYDYGKDDYDYEDEYDDAPFDSAIDSGNQTLIILGSVTGAVVLIRVKIRFFQFEFENVTLFIF